MRHLISIIIPFLLGGSLSFAQKWEHVGRGDEITSNVLTITPDSSNGEIYFGGCFDTLSGFCANHIGKWNGSTFAPLGTGINHGSYYGVFSSVFYKGEFYIGGRFSTAGGVPCSHIARWNGTRWDSLGSGTNGIVWGMIEYKGELYAYGDFTRAGGISVQSAAKWDGAQWKYFAVPINGFVSEMKILEDDLYICTSTGITRYDGTGVKQFFNMGALCIAMYKNEIYIGRGLSYRGFIRDSNLIAKWNGMDWVTVGGGISDSAHPFLASVQTMAVYEDELYVGGEFTKAGNVPAHNIARWNGSAWSELGSGIAGLVMSLLPHKNELWVSGGFFQAGGEENHGLVKWKMSPPSTSSGVDTSTVKIYPNPFSGSATIEISPAIITRSKVILSVYNWIGELVLNKEILSSQSIIDGKNLSSGIYLFRLSNGNGAITERKLIVAN